ncbi:MAG: methyltransferase domain-containing protein [Pseudomonadota bacterium]
MNNIEAAVTEHYGDKGLLARILDSLEAASVGRGRLQPEDLAPVEEFHIGGREATQYAVDKLSLVRGQHVLDVGCGIGGAARYIAAHSGCIVKGIDLTPEYIEVAKALTELTDLDGSVSFEVSSALDMPFDNSVFDAAITMHVAMNIPERVTLYSEIARVLKPGGTLCIFDVMKKGDNDLVYPVPWAQSGETSCLKTPHEMCQLLEDAGFDVRETGDRTDFALDYFRRVLEISADSRPSLGVHTVMGESAGEKMNNVVRNIENGCIAPVQMVAFKRKD